MNMIDKQLLILTLSTLALNAVKTEDTIEALKEILKKLNTPSKDRNDEVNSKNLYHSRQKHGNSKHGGHLLNSPNLMNVQTMNLFLKPNKRMNKDHITRTGPENACKIGRCGCNEARCGASREDNLADEVDRVINEINEQLALYENESRNQGDRVDTNKRDHKDGDMKKDRGDKYFDKIKEEGRDDDDVDITQKRDNDDALESNERNIFGRKDRLNKNELYNKMIKVNDNLDVVILDKSDLEKLLRNEALIDLTGKNVVKDDQNDDDDEELHVKVFQKYDKFIAEENKTGRTANVISLGDFFTLYEIMKEELVTKVMRYVKSKKQLESLNLKHMIPTQMRKLQNLKIKFKRGEIKEDDLEQKIEGILFGVESKAKVVAHNENNNYIFVPKSIYNAVLSSKKNLKNILRVKSHKRILPLTFQQKERLFNKDKVKTIPKLVWRKNSEKDIQRLGIPFELEVHGLGQVVP